MVLLHNCRSVWQQKKNWSDFYGLGGIAHVKVGVIQKIEHRKYRSGPPNGVNLSYSTSVLSETRLNKAEKTHWPEMGHIVEWLIFGLFMPPILPILIAH